MWKTGEHKDFYWIEFLGNGFSLTDFIEKYNKILIGKYLAVICFDSGPLRLTENEKTKGWIENNDITYSPLLTETTIKDLPNGGYDQWCLFNIPTEFNGMDTFVNYGGFRLSDRRHEVSEADPTWDILGLKDNIKQHEKLIKQFWRELTKINPQSFISYGDNFVFVTKDLDEINALRKYSNQ